MITLLKLAKDEHSLRNISLGLLFLGYKDNKKYSGIKLGSILDDLNISKTRNITLIMSKAELIKKANYQFDSKIELDLSKFYDIGYITENTQDLVREIRNTFIIISTQYLKAITEIEKNIYNIDE